MPRVSIIIPTYNRSSLLVLTLNSILKQTITDFEILVIDDGSDDGTELKVAGLNKKIRYYKLNKTGNPSILRNYGIERSKGDLIAFCDDDDVWYPEKLEFQFKYIHDFNIICTNADLIDSKGKPINVKYCSDFEKDMQLSINHLLVKNYIITSTVLLKKKILPKGPFDVNRTKSMAEDFDLWLKLSLNNLVYFIDKSLIEYRIHTSSSHKGENYFLLYENGISLINKYKRMVPRRNRKYAVWGIIKLRIGYVKLILRKKKPLAFFKELLKLIIEFLNLGFLFLLLNKILHRNKSIIKYIKAC